MKKNKHDVLGDVCKASLKAHRDWLFGILLGCLALIVFIILRYGGVI